MRAVHFGLCLILSATVAPGGSTAYAGNDGLTLAPTQSGLPTRELDEQLNHMLALMIASVEIGPDGKVLFNGALGDQRFLEPNSGRYWQISGEGQVDFSSRSLWGRTLNISGRKARVEPIYYDSDQFPNEPLRVAERTVRLPGSDIEWQFIVARSGDELD